MAVDDILPYYVVFEVFDYMHVASDLLTEFLSY